MWTVGKIVHQETIETLCDDATGCNEGGVIMMITIEADNDKHLI